MTVQMKARHDEVTDVTDYLADLLRGYEPRGAVEVRDFDRVRDLLGTQPDPWLRSTPLHLTASALIVHPQTGRLLLRWHQRQQAWLHVGGHADPGECDPVAVALREAHEETRLPDLAPWPDSKLQHLVIVPVPAGQGEPEHEHADLRFVFATQEPDKAQAETPDAPLRWLTVNEAAAVTSEDNLRESIKRVQSRLASTA